MVSKIIFAVIAAISIVLVGAYFLVTPPGSTLEPVVPPRATNMSSLIAEMVAESVPLEMENGEVVVGIKLQPFFSVHAQVVNAYGEDLQVFEYDSGDDPLKDADDYGLLPDGQFEGYGFIWVGTPHFYQAGSLIVLYEGDNSDIITLLEDLMGQEIAGGWDPKLRN